MPKITRISIKIAKCEVQLLPLILTISAFIILILLGIWQIVRLREKELFLTSLQNNLNNPAIDIKTLTGDTLYAKVKMTGHFLLGKNIHLYGRRSISTEKDGYYLVSPFQTTNDKIILVARGWFAAHHKKDIDDIVIDATPEIEITGIILPSEKTRLFVFDNDLKNNIWFSLDLQQAANFLGLKLENFYLIMDGYNKESDILRGLSIENLLHVRHDHLEYAITWFALAISLAVMFIIYHYRKKYLKKE